MLAWLTWYVLVCRLCRGKSLHALFQAIHEKYEQMQPGPQLDAFKAYVWALSMKIFYQLAQAGPTSRRQPSLHASHSAAAKRLYGCDGNTSVKFPQTMIVMLTAPNSCSGACPIQLAKRNN